MEFWINTIHRRLETNYSKACSLMKKLAKGESFRANSFGKPVDIKIGNSAFYAYQDFYGESSFNNTCRETFTTVLADQIYRRIGNQDSVSFVFVLFSSRDAVTKYSCAKIKAVTRQFLLTSQSYDPRHKDKYLGSGLACYNYKLRGTYNRKILMFPISLNDRGKAFTTASALIGLLRFPEYLFTVRGNPRTFNSMVNMLKKHYMKYGLAKYFASDEKERYYGWPHYNADYILWIKLAELGVFTNYDSSKRIHGPMSYIQNLDSRALVTTKLRQNYNNCTSKVLALGDDFLNEVSPKFMEFLSERKETLKL